MPTTKKILAGLAGLTGIVLCLALGWGDKQITIGSQTIGDSGSYVNGIGITNGLITASLGLPGNVVSPAGDTSLNGAEEYVFMTGSHSCTLGSAATNTGHKVTISTTSAGTNAILTVSAQTIAGAAKWTNTAIYTVTVLVSDGTNWQLAGSRGN